MFASCSILAALLIAAAPPPPESRADDDPFSAASMAPSDVRLFIHIRDAAALHAELADRPIARWLDSLLSSGQVERAWAAMARQAGVAGDELFDRCLGGGFTVLLRGREGGAEPGPDRPSEWAVITQLDPDRARDLLRPFNPKILRPRHGFAFEELPEQELLVARREGLIIVSPEQPAALLSDIIRLIDEGGETLLSSDPALARARALGSGGIAVFLRHGKPMGGWSAAVADVKGDRVALRHMARFDSPPFATPVTRHDWDMAPIESLKGSAILAMIAPVEAGEGRIESFLHVMLRRPLLPAGLERFPGQRQITILGEQEGRLLDEPIDMLVPALTHCVEVGNSRIDRRLLDTSMIDLAASIDRLGASEVRLQLPTLEQLDPNQPGRIELAPAIRSLTNIPHLAEGVSLNWTGVAGERSGWLLISSDPGQMNLVASSLRRGAAGEPTLGHWANCGFINGRRLAVHLRSWIDRADAPAAPGQTDDFKRSLRLIADLADGFQSCSWRLSRPSARTMELHAELTLSPPDSSRREAK